MPLQRLFVGFEGGLQLLAACQRIAAVVVIAGAVASGEAFGGRRVFPGTVERDALPARVVEAFGGFGRSLRLQQALALLIRAQPEVGELQGAGRLRLQQQERQAEQPAAAPGAGGEQQQRQQQPVALIEPGVQAGGFVLFEHAAAGLQQAEVAQVGIVQACLLVAGPQFGGEAAQTGVVQPRDEDGAVFVLEETAVLAGDRRALFAADAEDRQALAAPAQQFGDVLLRRIVDRAGHQQQSPAALRALFEQRQALRHGEVGASPGFGHQCRAQHVQQVGGGGQVVGQRHQRVRAAGIDDHGRLRVRAAFDQVEQLAFGLFQA